MPAEAGAAVPIFRLRLVPMLGFTGHDEATLLSCSMTSCICGHRPAMVPFPFSPVKKGMASFEIFDVAGRPAAGDIAALPAWRALARRIFDFRHGHPPGEGHPSLPWRLQCMTPRCTSLLFITQVHNGGRGCRVLFAAFRLSAKGPILLCLMRSTPMEDPSGKIPQRDVLVLEGVRRWLPFSRPPLRAHIQRWLHTWGRRAHHNKEKPSS